LKKRRVREYKTWFRILKRKGKPEKGGERKGCFPSKIPKQKKERGRDNLQKGRMRGEKRPEKALTRPSLGRKGERLGR